MLLRRFSQHLKDQNWFAVGLDVCVVVVGIVIGFQVTEWKDEQNKKAQALAHLQLVVDELNRHVAHYDRRKSVVETRLNQIQTLKKGLQDPDSVRHNPSEFMISTYISRYRSYTPLSRAVYDGLEISGDIMQLPSKSAISKIRDYYYSIVSAELVVHGTFEPWKEFNYAMAGYLSVEQVDLITDADNNNRALADLNVEQVVSLAQRLANDDEVMRWLPELESFTAGIAFFDASLQMKAQETLKELEAFIPEKDAGN